MVEIPLTRNKVALIDDSDYELVSKYKWHCNQNGYAVTNIGGRKNHKIIQMHRIIMSCSDDQIIDHINQNKLDNRKQNLRFCDKSTNNMNRGKQRNNKSGYKGVSYRASTNKWRATIQYRNKQYGKEGFLTKEEAALFYNELAIKFFGNFAVLNIIED